MRNLLRTFMKPFVIAGFLCFGIIYAQAAWNEPPGGTTPPDNNTDAPVNIGGTNQIKSGGLGVSSLSVYGNQYTQGNLGVGVVSPTQKLDVEGYVRGSSGLCIGNDCRSSWSEGASLGEASRLGHVGGQGGWYQSSRCPAGWVVTGIDFNAGIYIDGVYVVCSPLQ